MAYMSKEGTGEKSDQMPCELVPNLKQKMVDNFS